MRRPGGRLHRRHRTRDHRQHAPDDHDGTSPDHRGGRLAQVGPPPSDRLQPVDALAKKACQQFGKAARCHATVVKLSLPSGGVVVGSPQERPWKQASRCSQVAADKGLELLEQAEAKGVEIQVENG